MSFYSDLIHANTFTGGTYHGDGRYLGGTVTGTTYSSGLLALKRVSDPDITVLLGLGAGSGLTSQTFYNYTASTQAQLNAAVTGVTSNELFSMSAYAQNVYVELKPTGVITGTYGDKDNVPVLGFNTYGYVTGATTTPLAPVTVHDDMHGAYRPDYYYILPRTIAATTVNVAGVASSNRFVCYPFNVTHTQVLAELGVIQMATAAGQNIKLGVYTQRDYVPMSLVANFGTIDTNVATGYRGLMMNVPLSADTYFACFLGSATSPNISAVATNTMWGTIPTGTSIGGAGTQGFGVTVTTANAPTFPNTFTATTTVITSFTTPPALFLRFTGSTI